MENSQSLNLNSNPNPNPEMYSSAPEQTIAAAITHPVAGTGPVPGAGNVADDGADFYSLRWILSQSILKSRPFAVVTDELLNAAPLDIRAAAEAIAEPAGYLVVPVSSRAALLENVVNQILARIAVDADTNDIHDKPVTRRDAESRLRQLIATPDQRIAVVIQNGELVPAETFRALSKALRAIIKRGSEDRSSLPPIVFVIGAEKGFFTSLKGQLVLSILGENGVIADDDAGLVKLLDDRTELNHDADTAWRLTRERLGRHGPEAASTQPEPAVKPENSLVVVDPINAPRTKIAFYTGFRGLALLGSSIGSGFSSLFAGTKRRKKMERWMGDSAQANTRKTPTFQRNSTAQAPAQLK